MNQAVRLVYSPPSRQVAELPTTFASVPASESTFFSYLDQKFFQNRQGGFTDMASIGHTGVSERCYLGKAAGTTGQDLLP